MQSADHSQYCVGPTGARAAMLHFCALQQAASASLGAGLQQLRVDGRLLSGRTCQTVLQSLRRSLAAGPPPARQAADRRALQTCCGSSNSSGGRQPDGATSLSRSPAVPQQQQERQQHAAAAAEPDESPAAEPLAACSTNMAVGQVMAAQANFVRVKVEALEGGGSSLGDPPPRARLLCVVRALLKKIKQEVLVGDRVRLVGIDWTDGRGMVDEVLPRTSQLSEPAVANVSHVLLVFSAALPGFQPSPATRYLLSAEAAWLPVTVAINKADLLSPEEVQAVVDQVASWGYQAVAVSVVSGEGLDALTDALRGRVTVVAGPSGAGKSSIINALRLRSRGLESTLDAMAAEPSGVVVVEEDEEGEEEGCCSGEEEEEETTAAAGGAQGRQERPQDGAQPPAAGPQQGQQRQEENGSGAGNGNGATAAQPRRQQQQQQQLPSDLELQAVGQVSQRIGRGRHTTRNVTLLELEGSGGGLVVDTPGFNQPSLLSMPAAELGLHFPEVRRLTEENRCAFRGCQHLVEPGCVVREAGWERYPLYVEIHAELKAQEEQTMQRQASKKRREGSVRVKSRAGGVQGVEARLETKAHRRVSRRSVRQKLSDLVRDVEDDEAV